MTNDIKHWVVLIGNPVNGFKHFGPFNSPEAASEFGEHADDHDWWIAEMLPPAP